MQLDFDSLNDAINSAHECKTEGCERRVCDPDTFCMGCFTGLLTSEVIRIEEEVVNGPGGTRFRYVFNPSYRGKRTR